MQRKKLSIISVSERPRFCCLKYSLMACNAFGIMLGIFVVLFGISYPEEDFPGGYSGKTTAGISGVFIFFTGIGYCGAHHQKAYFLILYSFIIILFLGGNIAVSVFSPAQTFFDPATKQFYVMAAIMLLVMGLAGFLAWQVKLEDKNNQCTSSSNQQRNSSVNSNNVAASTQLSSNSTNNSQMQQQSLQQSPSTALNNSASGHHYQQPSLSAHFHSGQQNISSQNQPITMAVKQNVNGYPSKVNSNLLIKANVHPQMSGVLVQYPAVPPRYTQNSGFS